jgi:SAM-dependent methyltransferase
MTTMNEIDKIQAIQTPPYSILADIYDSITQSSSNEFWQEHIRDTLIRSNIKVFPKMTNILELACGTGSSMMPWLRQGFSVDGVEISPEMIAKAKYKLRNYNPKLECKNMLFIDYKEQYDLVLCLYDTVNYLQTDKELELLFTRVYEALKENGVFWFDINTPYFLRYYNWLELKDRFDNLLHSWSCGYDIIDDVAWCQLVMKKDGHLYEEIHKEKVHNIYNVLDILERVGFTVLKTKNTFADSKMRQNSKKIDIIVQKKTSGQQGKLSI